ncbi:tetratricopeptide repeat protein [Streptomyces sp. NPDC002928]|uniref:tetratricopeptide repeat protein n=1 Tax=Streptomyces sp. NPDC002928 TaxID=3154440 RepID=UPI0033A1AB89
MSDTELVGAVRQMLERALFCVALGEQHGERRFLTHGARLAVAALTCAADEQVKEQAVLVLSFALRDLAMTAQNPLDLAEQVARLKDLAEVGVPCDTQAAVVAELGAARRRLATALGAQELLHQAISDQRRALRLSSSESPRRAEYLFQLSYALQQLREATDSDADLDEMVECLRQALRLARPEDPNHRAILSNLANALSARSRARGSGSPDLAENATVWGEIIEAAPSDDPRRSDYLCNYAMCAAVAFQDGTDRTLLERAISLLSDLRTDGEASVESSMLLAWLWGIRLSANECAADLETVVETMRTALAELAAEPSREIDVIAAAVMLQFGALLIQAAQGRNTDLLRESADVLQLASNHVQDHDRWLATQLNRHLAIHQIFQVTQEPHHFAEAAAILRQMADAATCNVPTADLRAAFDARMTVAIGLLPLFVDPETDEQLLGQAATDLYQSVRSTSDGIDHLPPLAEAIRMLAYRRQSPLLLQLSVEPLRTSVATLPSRSIERHTAARRLLVTLTNQYKLTSDPNLLIESLALCVDIIPTAPVPDASAPFAATLAEGLDLLLSFDDSALAARHVSMLRSAITLVDVPSSERVRLQSNLGTRLIGYASDNSTSSALDVGLEVLNNALPEIPDDDPERFVELIMLCGGHLLRFQRTGDSAELDQAIAFGRAAWPDTGIPPTPERDPYNLAKALGERYAVSGTPADLAEAVRIHDAALDAFAEYTERWAVHAARLGSTLLSAYTRSGDRALLNRAIELQTRALEIHDNETVTTSGQGTGNPRSSLMANLGMSLRLRYLLDGCAEDLRRALSLGERSIATFSDDEVMPGTEAFNMAATLEQISEHDGGMESLHRAINMLQRVAYAPDQSDLVRAAALSSLCNALCQRFTRHRGYADIERAIAAAEEALSVMETVTHEHQAGIWLNYGNALRLQTEFTYDESVLSRAIAALRHATAATDVVTRAHAQSNLMAVLRVRFEASGNYEDLAEAVAVGERAAAALPEAAPVRTTIANLISSNLIRESWVTRNAATSERSVEWARQALHGASPGTPRHADGLAGLGSAAQEHFLNTGDEAYLAEALDAFTRAAATVSASSELRIFAASAAGFLSAAMGDRWPEAATAYETAINTLPLASFHGIAPSDRERELSRRRGLVSDAAAAAVNSDNPARAIEVLEIGRAVRWSQMLDGATAPRRLIAEHPALAARLQEIRDALADLDTRAAAHRAWATGASLVDVTDVQRSARLLRRLGVTLFRGGAHERGIDLLRRAAATAGNHAGQAITIEILNDLSESLGTVENFAEAVAVSRNALGLAEELGDTYLLPRTQQTLAGLLGAGIHEYAEAEQLLLRALDGYRETGQRRPVIGVFRHLGDFALAQGEPERAVEYLEKAQRLLCAGENEPSEPFSVRAVVEEPLARAYIETGRAAEAVPLLSALVESDDTGPVNPLELRIHLGTARRHLGNFDEAMEDLAYVYHISKQMGLPDMTAVALSGMRLVAREMGDVELELELGLQMYSYLIRFEIPWEQITAHLHSLVPLARQAGHPYEALTHLSLASVHLAAGDPAQGLREARAAVEAYQSNGDPSSSGQAHYYEGMCLLAAGDPDGARHALENARLYADNPDLQEAIDAALSDPRLPG